MSEERVEYTLLKPCTNHVTLDTELDAVRDLLPDLERLLTSALVAVQRAQNKEPTVLTRAERRRG